MSPGQDKYHVPPQKELSKYLFIDVLISKSGISEMMINTMGEGKHSQDKL